MRTTRSFPVWIVFVCCLLFWSRRIQLHSIPSIPSPWGGLHTIPYNFTTMFLLFLHGQGTTTHVKEVFFWDMFFGIEPFQTHYFMGIFFTTPLEQLPHDFWKNQILAPSGAKIGETVKQVKFTREPKKRVVQRIMPSGPASFFGMICWWCLMHEPNFPKTSLKCMCRWQHHIPLTRM